ncbi:unnamed protein product [Ixodes pacificus]
MERFRMCAKPIEAATCTCRTCAGTEPVRNQFIAKAPINAHGIHRNATCPIWFLLGAHVCTDFTVPKVSESAHGFTFACKQSKLGFSLLDGLLFSGIVATTTL